MLNSAGYQAHTKHIGITGNKKADAAAKAAFCQQITYSKFSCTDFYPSSRQHCSSEWQVSWDSCTSSKLHAVISVIGYIIMKRSLNRRDSSVLNGVQRGHTRLTHS